MTATPPPDQHIDESAILRRTAGDKTVRLTHAEVTELVTRWQASGRPLAELERTTGINPHRHTKKEGTAA